MNETRVRRARFRAWRRGFREADLILGPFADRHAPAMNETELAAFERVLDQPDHDVYAWILGTAPIPPTFDNDVMASLRRFAQSARAPSDLGG
jgi:antitoxin CptB